MTQKRRNVVNIGLGGGGGGPRTSLPPPVPTRMLIHHLSKKAVKKSGAQATLHQELSICMGVRVVYMYEEGGGISHVPSLKQPKFGAILWACCNISLPLSLALLRTSLRKCSSRLEGQWRNGLQSYENTKIYILMLIPCHKTVRFQRGAIAPQPPTPASARSAMNFITSIVDNRHIVTTASCHVVLSIAHFRPTCT